MAAKPNGRKLTITMRSLKDLMHLQGRTALVTGAGGHLGAAFCEALAELGASIILLGDNQRSCKEVAKQIEERFSVETLTLVVDLSDEEAVRSVPRSILDHFGRLDILVNNAALVGSVEMKGWAVPFLEQRSDIWMLAMGINLIAPFVLAQVCAEALAVSGHGSVVNVSSIYGMVGPDMRLYENTGTGNPAAYAASKAGLLQLTRWLATVLAPAIRVNVITPGGVWRDQAKTFHERYVERTPLKRMASEEDLKGAIAYLASDLSAYVTGHNLVVDGGWTTW